MLKTVIGSTLLPVSTFMMLRKGLLLTFIGLESCNQFRLRCERLHGAHRLKSMSHVRLKIVLYSRSSQRLQVFLHDDIPCCLYHRKIMNLKRMNQASTILQKKSGVWNCAIEPRFRKLHDDCEPRPQTSPECALEYILPGSA